MKEFIGHLLERNFQNRKIGIIENGSWAPMSGKLMKEQFEAMKDVTVLENMVTIRSTVKAADLDNLEKLAEELAEK